MGVGGQRHSLLPALPQENVRYPLYPRAGLDECWKISPLPGFRIQNHPARNESLHQQRYFYTNSDFSKKKRIMQNWVMCENIQHFSRLDLSDRV